MGSAPGFAPLLQLLYLISGSVVFGNSLGNKFCIGFMKEPQSFFPRVIVGTASSSPVSFTVEYSIQETAVSSNHTTIQDQPCTINFGAIGVVSVNGSYSERNKGFCITTVNEDDEVFVIPYLTSSNGSPTASYLALPYQELVTDQYEYYTLSTSSSSTKYYSGFLLVGLRDNTSITIYPSIPLNIPEDTQSKTSTDIEVLPGQSHTVVLHRRQTLYISQDGGADITSTRIVSDKPLTVISGHEAGSVPSDGTLKQMAQQIPPTQLWGDTFMIVPMEGHSLGQVIKVLSSVDNTEIAHNCVNGNVSVVLPKAGKVHEFYVSSTVYCYIKANNSVLVGQFPYSPQGNTDGDTTMILVPSIDQYYNNIMIWTLNTTMNSISITVPVEYYDHDDILYDGLPLSVEYWSPIYDNHTVVGYGSSLSVSNGHHRVYHNTGGLLSVLVYGFGIGSAYGFPAVLQFTPSKVLGVRFSSNNYIVQEGEGSVTIIIDRLTHLNYTDTYHINTTTVNHTSRFIPISEDIQFSPMESTISVSIVINDNSVSEGTGYFTVQLCHTTDPLRDVCIQTQVTILDDDVTSSTTLSSTTVNPASTFSVTSTTNSSTVSPMTGTTNSSPVSPTSSSVVSPSSMTSSHLMPTTSMSTILSTSSHPAMFTSVLPTMNSTSLMPTNPSVEPNSKAATIGITVGTLVLVMLLIITVVAVLVAVYLYCKIRRTRILSITREKPVDDSRTRLITMIDNPLQYQEASSL